MKRFAKMFLRTLKGAGVIFALGFGAALLLGGGLSAWHNDGRRLDWRAMPRRSAGLAPDPKKHVDTAIVQVYVAPTYGWRGYVAVHPWLIYKRAGQTAFARYEVIGWGGGSVVKRNADLPDAFWAGKRPRLLIEHRGASVEAMIDRIEAAVRSYPYPHEYRSYPGPNSNTFIAHIGRETPALALDLPANAIGKDYRPLAHPFGRSPSGRGAQVSLLGMLGLSVGPEEGFEANVLGLNFGIDARPLGLRLPFAGRLP